MLLEDEVEQNLHETVARARFHIIMIKNVTFGAALDLCGRVRTAKCAGDCSIYKNWGFQRGLWICVVEFLYQNVYGTAARAWFHINIVKTHSARAYLEDAVGMVSIVTVMSTTSCFNHIIMSTKYHQGVGKCSSSEIRGFRLEKTLGIQGFMEKWFIYSCIASFIHSFVRSFVPSFVRSFVPSFLPSFLPSFVPSFVRSFIPAFLRSCVPSFLPSFLRSFVPSFLRSFVPSFLRSFVPSFLRSFVPSFLRSFVPPFSPFLRFSVRSFVRSFVSFVRFVRSFVRSFVSFVHSFLPSFLPFTKATLYGNLQRKCRGPGAHFVRACEWKCKSTFHKSHFIQNFTGKMRRPRT